jgi:hypothetical protein
MATWMKEAHDGMGTMVDGVVRGRGKGKDNVL